MLGSKQCRRRYVRPKDPRTLAQLRARGRLSAASKLYSQALTDEQQDACIAAGAKVQCRRRMGWSGTMTGHQYWVHREDARRKKQSKATNAKNVPQLPPPQPLTRPTSGPHRLPSGAPPAQHRLRAVRKGRGEGLTKGASRRRNRHHPSLQVRQIQSLTASTQQQYRRLTGARSARPRRRPRGSPGLRGLEVQRRGLRANPAEPHVH